MATENNTKPHDPLIGLCESYEALSAVSADYLGHSSPVLVLLDVLNQDFRVALDDLGQRGMLS